MLSASWETCMRVRKQQLEPYMEQQTGSKLGKEYVKAVYCHCAYLTYMQCTSCKIPGWMKLKLVSRLLGKISMISDMQIIPSNGRKWRTEEPLDESERAEWKNCSFVKKTQKSKIMASGPITSWQIKGEKVETVTDFIFLGSKITADGDWSHAIKRCLLLGRRAVANLISMLKSRDITLLAKIHRVKAMVFPEVMYGCKSWTI